MPPEAPFDPVRRSDKRGGAFEIVPCEDSPRWRRALAALYDTFEPKGRAQGLPPAADERRRRWLAGLLHDGFNLAALAEGRAVGHASLLTIEPGSCEYLVFVHQDRQNQGIGSALTGASKSLASGLGVRKIWLTVEMTNPRAIHVYEKAGFRLVGPVDIDREMILDLAAAAPGS